MVRVDYEVDGRRTFNFTSDLSGGGAFLRGARKLTVGQELNLEIVLKEIDVTQSVRAVVRRVVAEGSDAGVAVEFLPQQQAASDTIRDFIRDQQLPKLESRVERNLRNAGSVIALATYYAEIGREGDALALYRNACGIDAPDIQVLEAFAHFLFTRVRVDGEIDQELMAELEAVLAIADGVEASDEIAHVRNEADLLRRQLDRHDRQRREREERERREREREERERLAETLRAEALAAAQRELAAELEGLEHKHRAELGSISAELAEARSRLREVEQELERSRTLVAESAREREALASQTAASMAELEGRVESLAAERDRLATRCDELEELGGQHRAAVDSSRIELEDAELRLRQLERDLKQSRELAADAAQARVELTEQNAAAVAEIENRLATAVGERLSFEVRCSELEDVRNALEARRDELEEATAALGARRDELEDAKAELEKHLAAVTAERQELATRCVELEAAVAAKATDHGEETAALEASVARLSAEAARATESEEGLRRALGVAEAHGEALRAAQRELAEVRAELESARQAQRLADKVQRGAARVGRQLGEMRRRHEAAAARVTELEELLDRERREGARLRAELEAARVAGENEAKVSGEAVERWRADWERAQAEARDLSQLLQAAREAAADQRAAERELEQQTERALGEQIQRLEELSTQLHSGLADSESARARVDEAIGQLEAERAALKGQLDDSITTAADGQRRLVDLVGGLEQLRDDLHSPVERLAGLSQALDQRQEGETSSAALGEALQRAAEREEAFAQLSQRLESSVEQTGTAWQAARALVEQGADAVATTRRVLEEQKQRFDDNAAELAQHREGLVEARARVDEWLATLAAERQASRDQLEADRAAVQQQILAERESWQAYLEQALAHQNALFQEEINAAWEREQELRAWIDQAVAAFEAQAAAGATPETDASASAATASQAAPQAGGSTAAVTEAGARAGPPADAAAGLSLPVVDDDASSPARPATGPVPAPPKRRRPTTGAAPEPPVFPKVVTVPDPAADSATLAPVAATPQIGGSAGSAEASMPAAAEGSPSPATATPPPEPSTLVEVADADIVALSADTSRGQVPLTQGGLRTRLVALAGDRRARIVGAVVLAVVVLAVLITVTDGFGDGEPVEAAAPLAGEMPVLDPSAEAPNEEAASAEGVADGARAPSAGEASGGQGGAAPAGESASPGDNAALVAREATAPAAATRETAPAETKAAKATRPTVAPKREPTAAEPRPGPATTAAARSPSRPASSPASTAQPPPTAAGEEPKSLDELFNEEFD